MVKTIKTTKGKLIVTVPDDISGINLGQLMAMQSTKKLNDLETVSILSDIPLVQLQNISNINDLEIFNTQALALAAQIQQLYTSDIMPQKVSFIVDNKPVNVKVMKNLSVEPAGAFMTAREVIADEITKHIQQYGDANWQEHYNPSLQSCAQVLAQYFYCRATGKPYNEYAATEFEEQVKQLPVTDALPIAKYFFLSYPNLSKPKTGFWHRLHRLWNSARALNSLRRLNTLTP